MATSPLRALARRLVPRRASPDAFDDCERTMKDARIVFRNKRDYGVVFTVRPPPGLMRFDGVGRDGRRRRRPVVLDDDYWNQHWLPHAPPSQYTRNDGRIELRDVISPDGTRAFDELVLGEWLDNRTFVVYTDPTSSDAVETFVWEGGGFQCTSDAAYDATARRGVSPPIVRGVLIDGPPPTDRPTPSTPTTPPTDRPTPPTTVPDRVMRTFEAPKTNQDPGTVLRIDRTNYIPTNCSAVQCNALANVSSKPTQIGGRTYGPETVGYAASPDPRQGVRAAELAVARALFARCKPLTAAEQSTLYANVAVPMVAAYHAWRSRQVLQ